MAARPLAMKAPCATPYWRDARIHNLGNCGVRGALHAAIAPFSTGLLDAVAYDGRDIRREMLGSELYADSLSNQVVDFGCGVGYSTADAAGGDGDARLSVGIDTSAEMVSMARLLFPDKLFLRANAETFGHARSCDVVTISFVLHEVPRAGRLAILRNARRIARKRVVVLDIAPSYTPSAMMLTGEPYLLDYISRIEEDVADSACISWGRPRRYDMVEGRGCLWTIDRRC
eukprot:5975259-Pleurochrysis_carterae.AAC.1